MPVRAVCKPHSPDLKRGALATDARGCSLWRSLLERPPPAPESRVRDPLGERVRTRVGGVTPPARFFWLSVFGDVNWRKAWRTVDKFYINNNVKEITFKNNGLFQRPLRARSAQSPLQRPLRARTAESVIRSVPVAQWLEDCVSSTKIVGSIPREHTYWQKKMYSLNAL